MGQEDGLEVRSAPSSRTRPCRVPRTFTEKVCWYETWPETSRLLRSWRCKFCCWMSSFGRRKPERSKLSERRRRSFLVRSRSKLDLAPARVARFVKFSSTGGSRKRLVGPPSLEKPETL